MAGLDNDSKVLGFPQIIGFYHTNLDQLSSYIVIKLIIDWFKEK